MEDFLKIAKSLENSGVLLKGVSETIQNEVQEQRGGFLRHIMLLGTLGTTYWEICYLVKKAKEL